MRIIIASDIHGSAEWCKKLVAAFESEKADKLLLLGDILYHGPRNPLPDGYSPAKVAELLAALKDKILCVRGNCDSEVDQMVLPFNISSDYAVLCADGLNLYLSHGHRAVPPMSCGDIYLTGHTHVPLKENCGYIHLNPGSVSLPKENSRHGYILYENRNFYFKDFDGNVYDTFRA
ncbi:MAG: phosphodiesterase [Clostridia bacterium]|nr:phosphodiesterase [Clostridia bacterium]